MIGNMRDLPMFLRAPRAGGLWLIGVLIPLATLVGFMLSYHNLLDWALNHGWPVFFAPFFPLLIDLLVIVGEVILFVAAIDGKTPGRVRLIAWAVVIGFTVLSIAGNVSHAATRDMATRVGWGLPPLVLAIALGLGLGELKRQAEKYRQSVSARRGEWKPSTARQISADEKVSPKTALLIQKRERAAVKAACNGHGGGE